MPEIRVDPNPSDPIKIIRAAVEKARAAGAVITTSSDLGVSCQSTAAPTWDAEPPAPVLSPLGAVLMVHQPRIADADAALASVLGVNPQWIVGFEDGVTGDAPHARGVYADGFRAGAEFRARFAAPRPAPVDTDKLIPQLLGSLTIAHALEALADTVPRRAWDDKDKADVTRVLREYAELYRALRL